MQLDIASQGGTVAQARMNLQEALELFLYRDLGNYPCISGTLMPCLQGLSYHVIEQKLLRMWWIRNGDDRYPKSEGISR